MFLVGLTGNIGSGKSTVAQLLSERGATIIDADVLARRAIEVGTEGHRAIVARWGTSILGADGTIDRTALRRIVFSNPQQLEQLNIIVHPEVERMRSCRSVSSFSAATTVSPSTQPGSVRPRRVRRWGGSGCTKRCRRPTSPR